jgi:hypothetical protein
LFRLPEHTHTHTFVLTKTLSGSLFYLFFSIFTLYFTLAVFIDLLSEICVVMAHCDRSVVMVLGLFSLRFLAGHDGSAHYNFCICFSGFFPSVFKFVPRQPTFELSELFAPTTKADRKVGSLGSRIHLPEIYLFFILKLCGIYCEFIHLQYI